MPLRSVTPRRLKALRVGILGLAGWLGALFSFSPALGEQRLPRVEKIVSQALKRVRRAYDQYYFEGEYTYLQLVLTEELDRSGWAQRRKEELYRVYPIEGIPYFQLIRRNGRPLSEKELRKQEERRRRFQQELARGKHRKEEDEYRALFGGGLLGKYFFSLVGQEQIGGHPTFVVAFRPKGPRLPIKQKLDRFLNKIAGKVWIEQKAYELVRAKFYLVEEVKVWWGTLLSLRRLDGWLERMQMGEGVWVPGRFSLSMDGRYLWKSLHRRQEVLWSGFRKLSPEVGLTEPEG